MNGGLEGRSERPATGMGSPERGGTQVENLCHVATGTGSPERGGTQVENLCHVATGMGSPERCGNHKVGNRRAITCGHL